MLARPGVLVGLSPARRSAVITKPQPVQRIPRMGALGRNADVDVRALREKLRGQSGTFHCYVVRTVEWQDGEFVQTGSGPNFGGDLITLCTCKRQMRSRTTLAAWRDAWVAGFTSVGLVPGGPHVNYLVYLMKVGAAYASHRDLWNALTPAQQDAKAADINPLGDVFRPRAPLGDWFDPRSYVPPSEDHVHCPDHYWLVDINDPRHPPLLAGDRDFSFVWSQPVIAWRGLQLPRDYKKRSLTEFLAGLG